MAFRIETPDSLSVRLSAGDCITPFETAKGEAFFIVTSDYAACEAVAGISVFEGMSGLDRRGPTRVHYAGDPESVMQITIIGNDEPLENLGPSGWVICFGLREKQIVFFCETDSYPDVVKFQHDFIRQTGFKLRRHPLNTATNTEIVRVWNPAKVL